MEAMMILVVILAAIGFFGVGMLWKSREVLRWRVRWIEMEHDLARLQGREPRTIDDAFRRKSKIRWDWQV